MSIASAGEMIAWLRANAREINLRLLHANDTSAVCEVEGIDAERTTEISVERIPQTSNVLVSFSVQLKFQQDYLSAARGARGAAKIVYPASLPLPMATGFVETHKEQGRTEYQMQFRMTTRVLAHFLAFAGAKGLRWFKMHWPVTNVGCGDEYIRFMSDPSFELESPNIWLVSMTAETMPVFLLPTTGATAPPPTPGSRIYEQPAETYDSNKPYEG
jgi:hypothetical protein